MRIISGGQTGVDRAALDAAMVSNVDCGGWCPEGRKAEDGRIPEQYLVTELKGAGYQERTLKNVLDSDGTVIISFGTPTGGTEQTLLFCIEHYKPHILIDAEMVSIQTASGRVKGFVSDHGVTLLNVAGPRASGEPRAYEYAYQVIARVLSSE